MLCRRPRIEEFLREQERLRPRTFASIQGREDPGPFSCWFNPPRWEVGHVLWFQERFVLTRGAGLAPFAPRFDLLFDSIDVRHEHRWDLTIPSLERLHEYSDAVASAVAHRLKNAPTEMDCALAWLTLHHEHYHFEAFLMQHQGLGTEIALPCDTRVPRNTAPSANDDVVFEGGPFRLGAADDAPWFVFDNERRANPAFVAPFAMASSPVTETDFLGFVEDGGYREPRYWSPLGWTWRVTESVTHPRSWIDFGAGYKARLFGRTRPLSSTHPVFQVSWFEADAYARWAGRRLPTELEWEYAATDGESGRRFPWGSTAPEPSQANLDFQRGGPVPVTEHARGSTAQGVHQMIGNVWEWTSSVFGPYPGFRPGPYREFSEPWFRDSFVLRGGSFATPALLVRASLRNFFAPCRRDAFAGFRTCAP